MAGQAGFFDVEEPRPIIGLQHPLTIYDTLFVPAVLTLPEVAA